LIDDNPDGGFASRVRKRDGVDGAIGLADAANGLAGVPRELP
jgi:hypothetical protein